MVSALYNALGLAFLPWILIGGLYHKVRRKRQLGSLAERLGHLPEPLLRRCAGREVIWIHAASVGEAAAARTLLAEFRRQRPRAVLLLSVWTETGHAVALGYRADGVFFLPIDLTWVIKRTLRSLKPALFVSIDTELWPNLTRLAVDAGVRVALANGRISDRSLRRIRALRLHWFYRPMVAGVERLLMQSRLDAERIVELGARAERVQVSGNVKFDEAFPTVDAARLAWWRGTLGLGDDGPVLLAGSTTHGEDELLVEVYRRLLEQHPSARLILVPRGVEHGPAKAELVRGLGYPAILRSELPARAEESRRERAVVVVDTLGELSELYAVATVAFVGRTLIPKGGSNVLQAAAQGKPVLVGPSVVNFRESVALLAEAGVLWTVGDTDGLAERVLALTADLARLAELGDRARAAVEANRGTAARTVAALLELIDGRTD